MTEVRTFKIRHEKRRRKMFKRDIYHQKRMATKDNHQEDMSDAEKPCSV
jgi:hypothetical protein